MELDFESYLLNLTLKKNPDPLCGIINLILVNISLVYYGVGAGNSGAHDAIQAMKAGPAKDAHPAIQITHKIGIDIIAVG
ncbi:unnamed protein product [Adineta ricciae]|uniref:Uncharacterized protein n=1 Tax=Adineta ricciae TaxID=249248 RepID=A0A814ZLK9_ADIRI|nr:unnamed protein product [Adineta ricciae]